MLAEHTFYLDGFDFLIGKKQSINAARIYNTWYLDGVRVYREKNETGKEDRKSEW